MRWARREYGGGPGENGAGSGGRVGGGAFARRDDTGAFQRGCGPGGAQVDLGAGVDEGGGGRHCLGQVV